MSWLRVESTDHELIVRLLINKKLYYMDLLFWDIQSADPEKILSVVEFACTNIKDDQANYQNFNHEPRQYRQLSSLKTGRWNSSGTQAAGWFVNRGISWHISSVVHRKEYKLQHQAFVRITKNCLRQWRDGKRFTPQLSSDHNYLSKCWLGARCYGGFSRVVALTVYGIFFQFWRLTVISGNVVRTFKYILTLISAMVF